MTTQTLDPIVAQASLTADQQARKAAFAQRELAHAGDTAAAGPVWHGGTGTVTYGIAIADNGSGFAEIGWSVGASQQDYSTQQYDWVGVFINANQALATPTSNPDNNYLGGAKGWTWASGGGPFTTDVALQAGMVAAYIIRNAAGVYVPVAISAPYPG
jgi:hypothetical protein